MNLFENEGIVSSIDALAKALGISKRQIYRDLRNGMPKLSDGRWDVGQCRKWREQAGGKQAAADDQETSDNGRDKAFYDLESAKHRARMKEIELACVEGRLIDRAEFEDWLAAIERGCGKCVQNIRAGCLGLVNKLPPIIANKEPRECFVILKEEITTVLQGLADGHDFIAAPDINKKWGRTS